MRIPTARWLIRDPTRGGSPFAAAGKTAGVLSKITSALAAPGKPNAEMAARNRDIPVISALVHHSFGDSSFFTGLSDYVVQLKGACMPVLS